MDDVFSLSDSTSSDTAQFQEASDTTPSAFDDTDQDFDHQNGEDWENPPEDEIDSLEPDPPSVEINGQVMSVEDLNRCLSFAQQAASEVLQLRQETALLDQYAQLSGMSRHR